MDFRQAATNAFNRQNGYGLQNIPYGNGDDGRMTAKPNSDMYAGRNNFTADMADPFTTASGRLDKNGDENKARIYNHQQITTRNKSQYGLGDYKRGRSYNNTSDDFKNNANSFNPMLKMKQERGDKQVRDYFNNKSRYIKGKGWQ